MTSLITLILLVLGFYGLYKGKIVVNKKIRIEGPALKQLSIFYLCSALLCLAVGIIASISFIVAPVILIMAGIATVLSFYKIK